MTRVAAGEAVASHPLWPRWYRPVAVGLTLALLGWAAVVFVFVWRGIAARGQVGYDPDLFAMFGRRFVETGEAYFPIQFGAPYLAQGVTNIYPPLAMYLFVPLAFVPLIAWWIIPAGILAWHFYRCRPVPWTWPILALILGYPPTASALIYGSSTIWSVAFICLGFRFPAAAALIAFKPVDALVWPLFVRKRSFWIGLAVVAVLALPFGGLWFEWWAAITNIEGGTPLRNITGWPLLMVPVVAWLGRRAGQSPPAQDLEAVVRVRDVGPVQP
jgi:hypothetical protein